MRNRSARRAYLPAQLRVVGGRILARPLATTGSGDLTAHARANGLVVLDADRLDAAVAIAELADLVRGYESVKVRSVEEYRSKLHAALAEFV
jgi:molybdopterin biosynthesis enzyme